MHTHAQWDSALSLWESQKTNEEATLLITDTVEELLGANGVCLITVGSTEKEYSQPQLNILIFRIGKWEKTLGLTDVALAFAQNHNKM